MFPPAFMKRGRKNFFYCFDKTERFSTLLTFKSVYEQKLAAQIIHGNLPKNSAVSLE